jgi:hypothetical protein
MKESEGQPHGFGSHGGLFALKMGGVLGLRTF